MSLVSGCVCSISISMFQLTKMKLYCEVLKGVGVVEVVGWVYGVFSISMLVFKFIKSETDLFLRRLLFKFIKSATHLFLYSC